MPIHPAASSSNVPALASATPVAVIGAGTMGSGIALVAARAGHPVLLHDAAPEAIRRGLDSVARLLDGQVKRGRLTAAERDAQLSRISPASDLDAIAPAGLVVEAIVEDLDVKAGLFGRIAALVGAETILATNTSSLSVTALAARLPHPGRVVGMHFFNPAPALPLVEVVSGALTRPEIAAAVAATARAWGKVAVHCRSTPGFIVNRVARPFYGEALRLLGEGAADAATLDAVLRETGGFRMGAFELMDLIGHDVNFAVTRSVYDAFFQDPRYRPSLVQKELVDAGLLGRKSGRGFFDYAKGTEKPAPAEAPPGPRPARIAVAGDLGPASVLADLARGAGIAVDTGPGPGVIRLEAGIVALTDGRMAAEWAAAEGMPAALFDLALDYAAAPRMAVAGSDPAVRVAAAGLFQALGKAVSVLDDPPGLAVMRTVAMLANEAADAVQQRIASAADIDVSMVKGVNYPRGPLAWADDIGLHRLATVIANLGRFYGEDRYRVAPLLRRMALAGRRFHGEGA